MFSTSQTHSWLARLLFGLPQMVNITFSLWEVGILFFFGFFSWHLLRVVRQREKNLLPSAGILKLSTEWSQFIDKKELTLGYILKEVCTTRHFFEDPNWFYWTFWEVWQIFAEMCPIWLKAQHCFKLWRSFVNRGYKFVTSNFFKRMTLRNISSKKFLSPFGINIRRRRLWV